MKFTVFLLLIFCGCNSTPSTSSEKKGSMNKITTVVQRKLKSISLINSIDNKVGSYIIDTMLFDTIIQQKKFQIFVDTGKKFLFNLNGKMYNPNFCFGWGWVGINDFCTLDVNPVTINKILFVNDSIFLMGFEGAYNRNYESILAFKINGNGIFRIEYKTRANGGLDSYGWSGSPFCGYYSKEKIFVFDSDFAPTDNSFIPTNEQPNPSFYRVESISKINIQNPDEIRFYELNRNREELYENVLERKIKNKERWYIDSFWDDTHWHIGYLKYIYKKLKK